MGAIFLISYEIPKESQLIPNKELSIPSQEKEKGLDDEAWL